MSNASESSEYDSNEDIDEEMTDYDSSEEKDEPINDYDSNVKSDEQINAVDTGRKRKADGSNGDLNHPVKVQKQNVYQPPTNDELYVLKETENLFHSGLFRLQISELLSEVTLKEKWKKLALEFVKKIIGKLKTIPAGTEHELNDQKWTKKLGVKVPFLHKPVSVKGKFHFFPPTKIFTIGSFPVGTAVKPRTHVNLAVVMPKDCIQAKDHLNQRYLRKCGHYLGYVAAHLKNWSDLEQIMFTQLNGRPSTPVLELTPQGKLGSHVMVRLHIVPEEDSFKLNRFHIGKNNVRRQWFYQENLQENQQTDESEQVATPHYNTTMLELITLVRNAELMKKQFESSPDLIQGIQLLKVWLHQRELSQGYGSFSGFVMTMYVIYLLAKRKLNKMMSSYQIVRNTLIHLGCVSWDSEGIILCDQPDDNMPSMQQFHRHFEVVFVDQTGYTNLCAQMSKYTLHRVKHEAQLAVKYLETPGLDAFEMLFMKNVPFMQKFDQVIHVSKLDNLKDTCSKLGHEDKLLDYCGDYVHAAQEGLLDLIHQCVGKRLKLLDLRLHDPPKWSITESPPAFDRQEKLSVGFLLDTDACNSILEKGPAADTLEAAKFRSFWGEKSELRRFQDGTICEAVVWPCKTVVDRRQILGKTVKHVLNRHCDIPRDSVTVICSQLDALLRLPDPKKKKKGPVYGTGEEQHLAVIRAYDALCKQLRSLKDLPLSISSIQGTSQVFRYAQVFPAMPATFKADVGMKENCSYPLEDSPTPPYTPSMSVLCILETSGKWPDDLEAVRRVKAAFHLQLSSLLESTHDLQTNPTVNYVDVLKDGFVFRVEIGYPREITLLKTVQTPEGLLKMVDNADAAALERKLITLPKLTSTLHSIHQQFPSYCCSVCLAKRWCSAQMLLDEHLPVEAVELLMAYVYLHPAPFTVPSSPLVAFIRFLRLLSTWDWKVHCLLVDLNSQFTREDYIDIPNKFHKDRATLPLMFISTPEDKHSSQWTKHQPTAPILTRLVLLARESLQVLQAQLELTHLKVEFKQIFRPPLEVFDILIHLNQQHVATQHQAVDVTKDCQIPLFTEETVSKLPVVNYDPVGKYITELKSSFSDLAVFFYDCYGGNVIGVLWKPDALRNKPFKVSHLNAHMPKSTGTEPELTPNVEVIVSDLAVIGQGLVKSIQTRTEKWKI